MARPRRTRPPDHAPGIDDRHQNSQHRGVESNGHWTRFHRDFALISAHPQDCAGQQEGENQKIKMLRVPTLMSLPCIRSHFWAAESDMRHSSKSQTFRTQSVYGILEQWPKPKKKVANPEPNYGTSIVLESPPPQNPWFEERAKQE